LHNQVLTPSFTFKYIYFLLTKGSRMRKQALHPRTANINTKQKTQAKLARYQALRWLAETFPQAFDNRIQIQPLKTGIMNDILLHADQAAIAGISKSKLREAVVLFTRRIDYLICLKAREMRIDLFGQPTSPVTSEEAECAALKIKKRIEKGAKNARKSAPTKPSSAESVAPKKPLPNTITMAPSESMPPHHYPEYTSPTVQNPTPSSNTRTTAVVIKPSRTYDPEAVARLKERLGLSQKEKAK
jgi:ProP effector